MCNDWTQGPGLQQRRECAIRRANLCNLKPLHHQQHIRRRRSSRHIQYNKGLEHPIALVLAGVPCDIEAHWRCESTTSMQAQLQQPIYATAHVPPRTAVDRNSLHPKSTSLAIAGTKGTTYQSKLRVRAGPPSVFARSLSKLQKLVGLAVVSQDRWRVSTWYHVCVQQWSMLNNPTVRYGANLGT